MDNNFEELKQELDETIIEQYKIRKKISELYFELSGNKFIPDICGRKKNSPSELLNFIWEKWKNAETPEEAVQWTDCYFLILDYVKEQEYNGKN